MATTTTNFGWDIPQSTDLVKDGATAIAALGQDIDTSMVDLKGGTTGQVLKKASNTDMDFTWSSETGDIEGVTAGTGLSGGGSSGDVTLSLDQTNYGNGISTSGKNRIINGGMDIDQRNNGASKSIATGVENFLTDRWVMNVSASSACTGQQVTDAPAGFNYSLKITSSAASTIGAGSFFPLQQAIELLNVEDLAWGTASAKAVTLSFWVKSSLTGTFGGSIKNANNGATYSFPFTYTISAANTWEQKTVSITAPTAGNWAYYSLSVCFGIAMGSTYKGTAGSWASANYLSATGAVDVLATNGATWQVTGVQFERGTVATPFQRAAGNIKAELAACQYYYEEIGGAPTQFFGTGYAYNSTNANIVIPYQPKRIASPSVSVSAATDFSVADGAGNGVAVTSVGMNYQSKNSVAMLATVASGLTTGRGSAGYAANTNARVKINAEL